MWLVMKIGCIECGEPSEVIGIFSNKGIAEIARDSAYKDDEMGAAEYQIFDVTGYFPNGD